MTDEEIEAAAKINLGERLFARLMKAIHLTDGTHTLADVVRGITEGRYQMMQTDKSVLITEVIEFPRCRTVHVFLSAGDLADHYEVLMPRLEAFALQQGADRITAVARMGWGKAGLKIGFKPSRVLIVKKLETAP